MLKLAHITSRDASEGYPGPVPTLQRRWEFDALLELYRQRRPLRVLEVGTYHGGTLYHWLHNAAAGARVVSVDSYATGVDNRKLFHEWQMARWADDVGLYCVEGDSRDPAVVAHIAQTYGPFDWVFLDAGHAEGEIRADWANYSALAAPGAVVALHDILPGRGAQAWIQVAPVWREIQRAGHVTQELIASEDVDWGGIGVVYL